MEFGLLNYTILALYMILMLAVGVRFMSGNRDTETYFRGGGTLPWWATGISIFATMLSAITFLAIPAKAFATNWNMLFFNFCVLLVTPIVVYFYLPRFRKIKSQSAYAYLEERFNRPVRWFASGLFSLFMITRIAIVLYLPAVALSIASGMNVYFCILLSGLITLIYSTIGGMRAVVWCDVIQGFILAGGALYSFLWLVWHIDGGFLGFVRDASASGKLDTFNLTLDFSQPVFWVVLLGGCAASIISYTSDQTMVQRYMVSTDEKKAAHSIWLNMWLVLPITLLFFSIGSAMFVYYQQNPEQGMPNTAINDAIYPWFIANQLPNGISGILIASIFAAAMSTLSSNINSASAALTTDFFKVLRPESSEHGEMKFARFSGIFAGLAGIGLALVLASCNIESLWDQFNVFLGLLTGTLGALFFLAFFVPRVDGRGAITGVVVSVLLTWLVQEYTSLHLLLYGLVEMVLCCLVAILTSRRPRR
ncbi:MAG: sodium:solute symporter [Planctomycetia bacterium]|nr:sodium:solute symporter [Planctomycetia bacterium]